jgi:hypothetical protein
MVTVRLLPLVSCASHFNPCLTWVVLLCTIEIFLGVGAANPVEIVHGTLYLPNDFESTIAPFVVGISPEGSTTFEIIEPFGSTLNQFRTSFNFFFPNPSPQVSNIQSIWTDWHTWPRYRYHSSRRKQRSRSVHQQPRQYHHLCMRLAHHNSKRREISTNVV